MLTHPRRSPMLMGKKLSVKIPDWPLELLTSGRSTNGLEHGYKIAISTQIEVVIIGAGIVGLATGLELTSRFPGISLAIVEKESVVAGHQSSHNSGVIHSGIYYKPGSLKARLCVEGREALVHFCQESAVPYDICGKVIVATSESELTQLDELYRRGNKNGLKGLRVLNPNEIREFEPYATGIRGIHVPNT